MGFTELKETAPNKWCCKYKGNYGVYTIKVTMDDGHAVNYSCSCRSVTQYRQVYKNRRAMMEILGKV